MAARSHHPGSCGGRKRNSGGRSGRCPARTSGSRNRGKARIRVATAHARVADARREFHHQLSTALIRENQAVAVEDLAVRGLARTRLAKSVHDAGWSAFVHMLEYKARLNGREFHRIGRFVPTSQTCSACGAKDRPKPLHIRTWQCPYVRNVAGPGHQRGGQRRQGRRTGGDSLWSAGKTRTPRPSAAQRSRNPPELTPGSGRTGGNLRPSVQGGEGVNDRAVSGRVGT